MNLLITCWINKNNDKARKTIKMKKKSQNKGINKQTKHCIQISNTTNKTNHLVEVNCATGGYEPLTYDFKFASQLLHMVLRPCNV